jgi:hypothetical protein
MCIFHRLKNYMGLLRFFDVDSSNNDLSLRSSQVLLEVLDCIVLGHLEEHTTNITEKS